MNVAVHVITHRSGSEKPSEVNTGTGGQAVGLAVGSGAELGRLTRCPVPRGQHEAVCCGGYCAGVGRAVVVRPEPAGSPAAARRPAASDRRTRLASPGRAADRADARGQPARGPGTSGGRFVPVELVLPGHGAAAGGAGATVDGELKVPERCARRLVGRQRLAGDPFGHTVIAGHVDSATGGPRLLRRSCSRSRATSSRSRRRAPADLPGDLGTDGRRRAPWPRQAAFDQTGDHRLVLITCTGAYDPARLRGESRGDGKRSRREPRHAGRSRRWCRRRADRGQRRSASALVVAASPAGRSTRDGDGGDDASGRRRSPRSPSAESAGGRPLGRGAGHVRVERRRRCWPFSTDTPLRSRRRDRVAFGPLLAPLVAVRVLRSPLAVRRGGAVGPGVLATAGLGRRRHDPTLDAAVDAEVVEEVRPRWSRSPRGSSNGSPRVLLMTFHRVWSAQSTKVIAMPEAPGPAGAADPVHVGLVVVGALVVDHVGDPLDVDAAGGDVGGDQDVDLALAEPLQRLLPQRPG